MELFMFDIETVCEYKDYETFLSNDERGAKLFEGKWKRMGWDQKFSLEDSYLDQGGIISTYGKICCISFGYIDSNNQKKSLITSMIFLKRLNKNLLNYPALE